MRSRPAVSSHIAAPGRFVCCSGVSVIKPCRRFPSLLPLAPLACLLAALLFPSASLAARAAPRIYIAGCDTPFFEPRSFIFECSPAVDPPPTPRAYGLTYRHYGSSVAFASGWVSVCLVGPPEQLQVCPYTYPQPPDKSEHTFAASFRFFDVISCTGGLSRYGTHLYYGEFSYTFAGLPWASSARPFTDAGGPAQQPICRPARLPRATSPSHHRARH